MAEKQFSLNLNLLEVIQEEIKNSGDLSISMMESVQKAFFEKNLKLCDQVVKMEKEMNRKDNKIEKYCIRFLALYSPKAKLLRSIIMYLEMNKDLERIGDLCSGIAKSIKKSYKKGGKNDKKQLFNSLDFFEDIFSKTLAILVNANKCVRNEDMVEAMKVISKDKEVNDSYYLTTEKILNIFQENPKKSIEVYELLKIVQRLERIGDHSKNIAEESVYMTEGRVLRH